MYVSWLIWLVIAIAVIGFVVTMILEKKGKDVEVIYSIYTYLAIFSTSMYFWSKQWYGALLMLVIGLLIVALLAVKFRFEVNKVMMEAELDKVRRQNAFDLQMLNLSIENLQLDLQLTEHEIAKAKDKVMEMKRHMESMSDELEELKDEMSFFEDDSEPDESEWEDE